MSPKNHGIAHFFTRPAFNQFKGHFSPESTPNFCLNFPLLDFFSAALSPLLVFGIFLYQAKHLWKLFLLLTYNLCWVPPKRKLSHAIGPA